MQIDMTVTIVKCLLGAKVSDIMLNLKVLGKSKCKFGKFGIYLCANDVWLCQFQITKSNVKEVV